MTIHKCCISECNKIFHSEKDFEMHILQNHMEYRNQNPIKEVTLDKLKKTMDKVEWILENFPACRGSDNILILKYLQHIEGVLQYNKETQTINFKELTYEQFKNLTNFETITRSRRKIFEKRPELMPSVYTTIKRAIREEVIRDNIPGI